MVNELVEEESVDVTAVVVVYQDVGLAEDVTLEIVGVVVS